ncbi:DUF4129 domain-containing protein [Oerskovia enterophila]|uniref:Protein-glutamine gamma-glutamyltransferase-like C-terminal domain-containing protein n=1 Tax=Oerskovia enterophila TaxID=43678 RepID=A0A161YDY1_9CELL|nr:DUF4129 domain-containing protein [Oerskovia enterophila]KZM33948.1 hypothetical protein OJAG_34320 [Oerskovia enterophila]
MTGALSASLAAGQAAWSARLELPVALRGDVPVTPDADTARRWLQEELLDPVYQDQPSLLMRFIDWLVGLFDGVEVLDVNPVVASLVVVGVVLVVAVIAYVIAGPVRLSRRARTSATVFEDDTRSATDLRAAADAAAAAGDWATAVVERYRAVVRSLEERVILDPRPGRTAHEAADAAALRLPSLADRLAGGARLFDDVRYGKVSVGAAADQTLRELDAAALATRPTPAATGPTPDPADGAGDLPVGAGTSSTTGADR